MTDKGASSFRWRTESRDNSENGGLRPYLINRPKNSMNTPASKHSIEDCTRPASSLTIIACLENRFYEPFVKRKRRNPNTIFAESELAPG
jgi:hypothetical protein